MTTLKIETIVAGKVTVGEKDSSSESEVRSARQKSFYIIRVGEKQKKRIGTINVRLRGSITPVRESA